MHLENTVYWCSNSYSARIELYCFGWVGWRLSHHNIEAVGERIRSFGCTTEAILACGLYHPLWSGSYLQDQRIPMPEIDLPNVGLEQPQDLHDVKDQSLRYCAASLRVRSARRYYESNFKRNSLKRLVTSAATELRCYRKYSIKLMLAWEMCCRFPPSPVFFRCLRCADMGRFWSYTALGAGILVTYPQISTIAGVQGLVIYALSSALPLLIFGYLGPIIRRKCPEGFILTEWTRQRYGAITALYLSFLTWVR